MIPFLLFLPLIISPALATPFKLQQRPFTPETVTGTEHLGWTHDTENEEGTALLHRYAPVIKLSSKEEYFPSSIEYMLPHYTFTEDEDGNRAPVNTTLLTPPLLDRLPRLGQNLYLSIPEEHNAQPFLVDENARYLLGPAGQEGGMKRRSDGRGVVQEKVYAFWVDQGRGILDLWYWTFYPFNLGKPVGPFGVLGNHVADWEYMRMRTINGTPISVDYHSHNGGSFSAGTTRWSDVLKVDDRPVGFSAAGSHGIWPTPGDHIYAELLNVFRLVDATDDVGAVWDTKGHVLPFKYWNGPQYQERRKIWHRGDESWLNYRGKFGNKGENDCWWHKLVGICQLVDAPPGPNRYFGVPPDCILGSLSWETSTYSFYLSASAVGWAEDRGVTAVQVEQVCARPRKKHDDSDDDDDDDDDDYAGNAGDNNGIREGSDMRYENRTIDYVHDATKDDELEIWVVNGMTDFKHHDKHEATTLPCSGVKAAVKAYRISLCLGDGRCITTSHDRKLCTYEEGKKGYRFGNAVKVEDVDEWRWNLGQ